MHEKKNIYIGRLLPDISSIVKFAKEDLNIDINPNPNNGHDGYTISTPAGDMLYNKVEVIGYLCKKIKEYAKDVKDHAFAMELLNINAENEYFNEAKVEDRKFVEEKRIEKKAAFTAAARSVSKEMFYQGKPESEHGK